MCDFDVIFHIAHITKIWKRAFGIIAGWSQEETLRWAAGWGDQMLDANSWFYHDDPAEQIAAALILKGFWDRHPSVSPVRLRVRLADALLGDLPSGGYLDRYDDGLWMAARRRVEVILAEFGEVLPPPKLY